MVIMHICPISCSRKEKGVCSSDNQTLRFPGRQQKKKKSLEHLKKCDNKNQEGYVKIHNLYKLQYVSSK